jgi:hypothetical protein
MYFKSNLLQKILAILSWLLVIGGIYYLIFSWDSIPNKLPIHSTGLKFEDIDRYGDKIELIPVILIFMLIYVGISIMAVFPGDFNKSSDIRKKYGDVINKHTKTMWLLIRVEYIFLIIYLIRNVIKIKGIGNGILIFVFLLGFTFSFYNLKLSKYH